MLKSVDVSFDIFFSCLWIPWSGPEKNFISSLWTYPGNIEGEAIQSYNHLWIPISGSDRKVGSIWHIPEVIFWKDVSNEMVISAHLDIEVDWVSLGEPNIPGYEYWSLILLHFSGVLCKSEKRVFQDPSMEASNGKIVNLKCSHPTVAANENIYWYRQFPNQGPRYLVNSYKGSKVMEEPRGTLTVENNRSSSILSINRITLEDSAVYFCALGDTVLHSGAPAGQ